jgi:hypothetical protein
MQAALIDLSGQSVLEPAGLTIICMQATRKIADLQII